MDHVKQEKKYVGKRNGCKETIPQKIKPLIHKYNGVFVGTGKSTKEKVRLYINPNVPPVVQKVRRILFKLRKKVEEELENLRKADIIEDVKNEPTPWIPPIVVVPNKHNPDKLRLCIDIRQANKAIERIRHPIPSTDDLIHDLNEAKFFCKLDFSSAFL